MSADLQNLLDSIDPKRTLDETSARVDAAINCFVFPGAVITEWSAFRTCLATFYRHVEATVLRVREPVDIAPDFYWSRCLVLLQREYGPNGHHAAFELVRTGAEGGLLRVLKDLSRRLAEFYAENEVRARVTLFLDGLSITERRAATDQYVQRFGYLLPSELTEGSAARIHTQFANVLQEHPRLIQRLSRVARG